MADYVKVDTDVITGVADSLESLNKQLSETLTSSKATVDGLHNVYEGEAAQATITAFDELATKYFQNYEDTIAKYVAFLRVHIADGYFKTEVANTGLADTLKQ